MKLFLEELGGGLFLILFGRMILELAEQLFQVF